ncbi:MAG TPA: DUF481 domain-containing protein [Gammaproteobacteria bacterium]
MRRPAAFGVLALLASAGAPAVAADDLVVLVTGNRMTGEVVELSRGELTFAIDGAGRVDIDWSNVELLESMRLMQVELGSGERLSGTLRVPSPARLEVVTEAGATPVDMREVIRITPIQGTFLDRTSGSLELGFDTFNANDELDWTLHGELEHRTQRYLTALSVDSLVRRRDDAERQQRNDLVLSSRRFLRDRWFALGMLELEENRELGLSSRALIGGAIGRTLRQTNRTIFALYAGLDYDRERYRDVPGTADDTEVLGALEWDWFEVSGDMELEATLMVFSSLEESRNRAKLDVTLRRGIVRGYYWSVNLYEDYDSDPPADFDDTDYGLGIGIGRQF